MAAPAARTTASPAPYNAQDPNISPSLSQSTAAFTHPSLHTSSSHSNIHAHNMADALSPNNPSAMGLRMKKSMPDLKSLRAVANAQGQGGSPVNAAAYPVDGNPGPVGGRRLAPRGSSANLRDGASASPVGPGPHGSAGFSGLYPSQVPTGQNRSDSYTSNPSSTNYEDDEDYSLGSGQGNHVEFNLVAPVADNAAAAAIASAARQQQQQQQAEVVVQSLSSAPTSEAGAYAA